MYKLGFLLIIIAISGCIDLGRVGTHPTLKTAYFDGKPQDVSDCLFLAAQKQRLTLLEDETGAGGLQRYNLKDGNDEDVAWIDLSSGGRRKTSANFYYAPHASEITAAINSMISQCRLL